MGKGNSRNIEKGFKKEEGAKRKGERRGINSGVFAKHVIQ